MEKVIMTADAARMAPVMAQKQIDVLKVEIEALTKKRKDLKRFLDIDKEKAELEKIKKKAVSIHDKAVNEALQIVKDARMEAEKEKEEAVAYRGRSKSYSDRLIREAEKKNKEADLKIELAERVAVDSKKAADELNRKTVAYMEMVISLKKKFASIIKAMQSLEGG